nr:hypothetical protein [Vibrio maerlii]
MLSVIAGTALANDDAEELQDMSDPLAVYTQAGIGYTDKGINIKVGQSYDTGSDTTMAMNVMELKGVGGDALGFRDQDDSNNLYKGVDDSIDSVRFRNFKVDLTNGRGSQLDVVYSFDDRMIGDEMYTETVDVSYSLIQALPKWGPVQFYPLAGLGATLANQEEDGYEIPGTFAVVGMYSKLDITDKIWLNYNPMWLSTLSGSEDYKDNYYANDSSILTHEFAVSYQLSKRTNIRYFANWNEEVDFADGDHRIEFNYQF